MVGVEWGFALAFYHFLFLNRFVLVADMIRDWVAWGGIIGIVVGAIGGLFWGWQARAVLGGFVMTMAGGFLGAFASSCFGSVLYKIRDGDGLNIEKDWVVLGAIIGGVLGASGLSLSKFIGREETIQPPVRHI